MRSQLACYQLVCHFKCDWTRARTHTRARCTPRASNYKFLCVSRVNRVFASTCTTESNELKTICENAWRFAANGSHSHSMCSMFDCQRLGVVCVCCCIGSTTKSDQTTTATTTHLTSETKTIRNDSNVRRTPEAIKAIRNCLCLCACDPLDAANCLGSHTRR